MPKAKVNGVTLHYQRFGKGPDVVLLHGLTANLAFWHPPIVTGLAADYSVTLMDFRGHGRSDTTPAGYTTRDWALDVNALLDHLEIRRAVVIGHSYGGAVALHLSVLDPARAAGLVLADARVRSLQPVHGLAEWEQWPAIRERLAVHDIHIPTAVLQGEFGLFDELARLRLAGALDGVDLRPYFVPFSTGSRRAAERWQRLVGETIAREEFTQVAGLTPEAISAVRPPVLAVMGEFSHCWPTQRGLAGLLPACATVSVAGVGHFHPILKPAALLAHTRTFLGQIEPWGPGDAAPVGPGEVRRLGH